MFFKQAISQEYRRVFEKISMPDGCLKHGSLDGDPSVSSVGGAAVKNNNYNYKQERIETVSDILRPQLHL